MKRIFGDEATEIDGSFAPQLKKQRPVLGLMREVMGVQCVQSHLPKLEPFLRRVVQEEVGKALGRYVHSASRLPNNRIERGVSRPYRLHFQNSLPQTLFTGSRIEAEGRVPLQIAMRDAKSNKIITSGPLSSAKIEIVVLDGDFGTDDQMEWTEKEFGESILREREGKRPLLTGELVITLDNGVGYLGDVAFTDNSSWIRSRKFRLGARLQSKFNEENIQESISGPFWVKDHRGELYRKHHPPSLDDEVWRLEKIGKDGAFHRRLSENGINTVQDFLKLLAMDPDRLRTLLGSGMSTKIWEATLEHAKECVLDDRHYFYCNGQGVTLLFNSVYELVGAMFDNRFYELDNLNASQKILVNKFRQLAYKNPELIIELNPTADTLSRSLPTPNFSSAPQIGCAESLTVPLPALRQDGSAAQLSVFHQSAAPCNELLDPLLLKDCYTEDLGSSQYNGFSMRDLVEVQLADIPSVGLAGPIITGNHNPAGYNSEMDMASTSYPLPIWDHATSGAESNKDLVTHTTGLAGSHIRWAKVAAALKLMAASKHLAAKRDTLADLGYPTLASSMSLNSHRPWFSDDC